MYIPTPASSQTRRSFLAALGGTAALAALPSLLRAAPATAAAPDLSAARAPELYRFKVGAVDALVLSDGLMTMPRVPAFAPEAAPGAAEAALRAAFLPTDAVSLAFNVLLLRIGSETILVDTGGGTLMGAAAGRLPANLRAAGIAPEQVTGIVLSHAHIDHLGGLLDPATGAPAFPNARLFISRKEFDFWTAAAPDVSGMRVPDEAKRDAVALAAKTLKALGPKFEKLDPGHKIVEGLELVPTPGHTPGHSAVLVSSGNEQLLHIVDAAHHPVLMFAHPEWSIGYDTDPVLAGKTRRKIFDRAAADRTRMLGYHLPFPGIGHVKTEGSGYAWVPEPWNPA